jgi:uncharacterized membrane protein
MRTKITLFIMAISLVFITACGKTEKYSKVSPENGLIKIDVSKVDDGKAHYYTAKVGGKDVKFFILKSNDGIIRAAFDACDVCYSEKKGYRQDGDYMICNNCGQRFHSSRINVVKGGCNPSPIQRKYDEQYVYINYKDLRPGTMYF